MWIDTHCHLDAPDFAHDVATVREQARAAGVGTLVLPAVHAQGFSATQQLARRFGDAYALGIHPFYVPQASEADLDTLRHALQAAHDDPHLVAVGEIGLDFFVPALCEPLVRKKQTHFYNAQLQLALEFGLPVILHVRRSADLLLKQLRHLRVQRDARGPAAAHHGGAAPVGGIVHAFSGSMQQAQAFIDLGFKLGFGGALTFPAALQLRHLASELPLSALVLETDAPDMPPHWLYRTRAERDLGLAQRRNAPVELPRVAQVLADLRGISLAQAQSASTHNARQVLPKLAALLQSTLARPPVQAATSPANKPTFFRPSPLI
jgi:TatD DNase family protein